jgi:hypothetical protein
MKISWVLAICIATASLPAGTSSASAAPLSLFQHEELAQRHCPNDTVVWVDFKKRVYYVKGQRLYGRGRTGSFVCREAARQNGYRRSLFGRR